MKQLTSKICVGAALLASIAVPLTVTAQSAQDSSLAAQRQLLSEAVLSSSSTATAPAPGRRTMRLAVGAPVARNGEVSLGLQGDAGEHGVDIHEINTAFASQSQDPGGVAGAKVSFHF